MISLLVQMKLGQIKHHLPINIINTQLTSFVEVSSSSMYSNKPFNNIYTQNLLWLEENSTGHTKTNQKALLFVPG